MAPSVTATTGINVSEYAVADAVQCRITNRIR
jgi:hypothetical protein